jgi:D-beta-D-heptose 7-phosphate kinase/D-beta-D-heptose 1-phosphate adenosyltransferase
MNKERHLIPLVERLDSAVIACVGDLMLDHFVYGDVHRISPEAPIPVIRVDSQQSMLGGMGNVVRNLGALGCSIRVFSVIGDDSSGDEVHSLLRDVPRTQTSLVAEPGRKTPVKVRYVANGQQLLRADNETSRAISDESFQKLVREFERGIADCPVVVLSDYSKGMLVGSLAAEFIRIARKQGKRVIVDPKGTNFLRYLGATIIKPNLKELAEATGGPLAGPADHAAAARKLLEQTQAESILVTRGSDGMLLVSRDGRTLELPALAREVFDVSGAGDTVAANLAAALSVGALVEDAVRVANFAAGIVVGKVGTAVVDRSEIIHEIEHQSALLASDKILRLAETKERRQMWRRMGLRVGFIFGPFSHMSPDDINALEKARAGCDRLLVAVQNDRSLMQNGVTSGHDQSASAYLLASMVFSDAVIMCNSQTPEKFLADLQPDVVFTAPANQDAPWVKSWQISHLEKDAPRLTHAARA